MEERNTPIGFSDYTVVQGDTQAAAKKFMANVFMWMFAALLLSAGTAYYFASNPQLMEYIMTSRGLGFLIMFAPLGFVMAMGLGFQRFSYPVIISLFLAFAVVNGISFSFILLAYTASSIVTCFLSAAVMFGIMAVMGYTTHQDLTSFGRILMMGAIGIVVAMLINFFMHSEQLDYIISIIGVCVFTGLTAYDVQKLKRIGANAEYEGDGLIATNKLSVLGAMNLYLDFINMFLFLLRLFGRRK